MAVKASGTQTAVLTTEHTLATVTPAVAGEAMELQVDISALQANEIVTLKIKSNVLTAGAVGTMYPKSFNAEQALITPIVVLPPILFDQNAVFTLTQTNGTGRSFPWKVLSPG